MHAQGDAAGAPRTQLRRRIRMEQRGWIRRTLGALPGGDDTAPEPADAGAATATPGAASIAAGCELEGRLQLEGPLVVHGDFKGEIDCQLDVVVAPGGSVQGPIRARSVELLGSVVGDLHARREIVLRAGARLHGDAAAASLVVERGACFEGRSLRLLPIAPRPAPGASDEQAPAPPAATPAR